MSSSMCPILAHPLPDLHTVDVFFVKPSTKLFSADSDFKFYFEV